MTAPPLEADKVIYDETTKRLHAEGNVRLTEADGNITYADIMDLSDDFRDGFVDSLRLDTARPDPHGGGARRPLERHLHGVPQRRLHRLRGLQGRSEEAAAVAGQGARGSSTTSTEKMIYFEDARLEFFGMPVAYLPYFSAPDPTVKRKSGFLMPMFSTYSDHTASASKFRTTGRWRPTTT